MKAQDYQGPERRNFTRIVYKPDTRPVLMIGNERFETLDINTDGMRFQNPEGRRLDRWLHGTVKLLNGESVAVDGKIEWEHNGEVGVSFGYLIPSAVIEREQRHIVLNLD